MAGKHRRDYTREHVRNSIVLSSVVGLTGLLNPIAEGADIETWDKVAQCESSGNWSINTGNGYSGGLQFLDSTWDSFGGNEFADTAYKATKSEQIQIAENVLAVQGWNAWPVCSKKANATAEKANPSTIEIDPPTTKIPVVPNTQSIDYTIKRGDTLSAIAQIHGTTIDAILNLNVNEIENRDLIYVDQEIRLK